MAMEAVGQTDDIGIYNGARRNRFLPWRSDNRVRGNVGARRRNGDPGGLDGGAAGVLALEPVTGKGIMPRWPHLLPYYIAAIVTIELGVLLGAFRELGRMAGI